MKINKSLCLKLLILSIIFLNVFACRNDIDEIHAISNQLDLPNQSGKNIEVWYTDSGKLQLKFIAPAMSQYVKKAGGPYYEFPAGVEVLFYDKLGQAESKVTAGYAIYYEEKKLWEARDSVVAKNLSTNEQLETEQLYWDLDKKLVYSIVFTKITNTDGVYYGESGFEANQDMKKYKLKGSSGTVNVKDETVE
jgi:LPS export ABC transporter protein LptC